MIRVLTFGWEFPPEITGGLGVACAGLTEALIDQDVDITFVLPRTQNAYGRATFIFADVERGGGGVYTSTGVGWHSDRSHELLGYAKRAFLIGSQEHFDVIHAHDWKSYMAGLAAGEASGKPVVLHVHATAYDQSGGNDGDPLMKEVEQYSFPRASAIVTVSQYTKNVLVKQYGVDPSKIYVVHNGADLDVGLGQREHEIAKQYRKKHVVLYHGRITIQKGVDYFIRAAQRVLEYEPQTLFLISGSGDMEGQIIRMAHELGIQDHVVFVGATWGEERDRLYRNADVVVMPSVSEPFGLVPLEALMHGAATLVSKQSGVSEVLKNALRVDFWDVDEMTNQIVAVLRYGPLKKQLAQYGKGETQGISWENAARKVKEIYNRFIKF